MPIIVDGSATSWKFVLGPMILYLIERLYRLYMSQTRQLKVLTVIKLPDSQPVLEVRFQKVKTEPGQV